MDIEHKLKGIDMVDTVFRLFGHWEVSQAGVSQIVLTRIPHLEVDADEWDWREGREALNDIALPPAAELLNLLREAPGTLAALFAEVGETLSPEERARIVSILKHLTSLVEDPQQAIEEMEDIPSVPEAGRRLSAQEKREIVLTYDEIMATGIRRPNKCELARQFNTSPSTVLRILRAAGREPAAGACPPPGQTEGWWGFSY